ncbi:hypothetical protein U8P73_33615 (plasmid) [Rhizobium beringeri]|uniref:hypothetical protein n=1 Tax=Rhizobium TaxID=379 RepID=UPI0013EEFE82|nr:MULTISPECIES: hypothetical protein [Rhizobium]WSG93145.1 hypothetical protein U8P73_33615 [Rhizobium beringeri]
MNHINTATAVAAAKPREDDEAVRHVAAGNWKPFPCLLTRRELQALIAEQLG